MYTCERCQKSIEMDQEYEMIETHYFHTSCYIEGLVGAIVASPNLEMYREWNKKLVDKKRVSVGLES